MELSSLTRALAEAGATDVAAGAPGTVEARLPAWHLPTLADRLAGAGASCQFVAAADARATTGVFALTYVFAPPTLRPAAIVRVAVPGAEARIPSLATRSFAASRFEREIHDLFGLVPVGHPDLRRLALHQFWPAGYWPLRRDVAPRDDFADEGQPFPFRRVEGEGLFEITVGPVHAGIIEPGHFRFSVEGETIVNLETRLGFVHKGTEKLFETLPLERAPELAERVSGDTSAGHALALCQALEALAGCAVPSRAAWLRVVLLELERLYNHVADVGMIVNDTGFAFGHAHCFRIREELLRLNERVSGHRLLRGAILPGGVAGPVERAGLPEVAAVVERLVAEFGEVARLSLDNTTVLERLQGTGRLTLRTARELGVVGLVGRASGIDADARRDAPFAAYDALGVRAVVYDGGDVLARTLVRIDEAREAARLIRAVAGHLPDGPTRAPLPPFDAGAEGFGLVEAWRGPVWYWAVAEGATRLARVKVVDPSFRNWPALEYAVLKNIVPDFPLCNKSFNLSYAGNDL
ncbi:MAG: NADH-quinone oxidoreductase subunit C [Candidatus Rokubacteria bacterium]|nr:NADH-quinone oxidoreductase subunit C [Candidatus Rokubacteria bacterium]